MSKTLKIGDRVFITDNHHPWHGKAGTVVSDTETYGLGWTGQRVQLDDNCGEAYIKPDQVMGPGRVTSMKITYIQRKP